MDLEVYIAALEAGPQDNPLADFGSLSKSPAYAAMSNITSSEAYIPKGPYDKSILARMNGLLDAAISDSGSAELRGILVGDEQQMADICTDENVKLLRKSMGVGGQLQVAGGNGKCGYVAISLKMCVAYLLPGIDAARRSGAFIRIIDGLLSDSDEGAWSEAKTSTLLLCSHLASYHPTQAKSKIFLAVQNLVNGHMERITSELSTLEDAMRASGEFAILEALSAANTASGGNNNRLRQDDPTVLGNDPLFAKFRDTFTIKPVLVYNYPYYRGVSQACIDALPEDMRDLCEYISGACHQALQYGHPKDAEGTISLNFQPYILFLILVAREMSEAFHRKVKEVVGDVRYGTGDPSKANIKGFTRMREKQEEKYTPEKFGMPSCAVMCDIIRCLIVCKDPKDLVETFGLIKDKFDVVRVKNGFAEKTVPFGFRQILINVKFVGVGRTMICEIQLNLADYVKVKHKIHKLYTIGRCEDNSALRPDLYTQLFKKTMPF